MNRPLMILALALAARAGAATIDLSTVTANYEAQDGDTLTGTLGASVKISIADGAKVTLKDATINGTHSYSYAWAGITCTGDATLVLAGENIVKGFCEEYPGIHIARNKTLTIRGDGSLAASSSGVFAAGIGGGNGSGLSCGNIVIEGGTIYATGGGVYAAGIGGGYRSSCGNITITDGVASVTATKGSSASNSIGAGFGGRIGTVTIGGVVGAITQSPYTYTGNGAVDGGGHELTSESEHGTVAFTVDGETVEAAAEGDAVTVAVTPDAGYEVKSVTARTVALTDNGDGTYSFTMPDAEVTVAVEYSVQHDIDLATLTADFEARDGDVLAGTLGANVKITVPGGASVTLRDATINGVNEEACSWAGITCTGDATIVLSGENTVKGFYEDHPGVYIAEGKTLTIRGDGSLDASSNGFGAGIGGGFKPSCGNIVIEGGTITATGGGGAAGIGGGWNECGNIVISGGTVTATGGRGAPGIGGGFYGSCGDITITDGVAKVTATAGENATDSVGAGKNGSVGTVTVGGVEGSVTESPFTYPGEAVITGEAKVAAFRRGDDGSWTLVFEIDAADAGGTITEASFAVKTGTDVNALDANADFEIVKTETSGGTVTVTVRIASAPDDASTTRFFALGGK